MKLLLVSVMLCSSAWAAPLKSVTVYSSFDTPGYNEIAADGRKTGFEIELAEAVFATQGYRVDWREMPWSRMVAELAAPSAGKNHLLIASIESRPERRQNWLFAPAVEFDASHYFFASRPMDLARGDLVDGQTGRPVPGFVLDDPRNRVNGAKLRIATWGGSVFEHELRRVHPRPRNLELVFLDGDPMAWLAEGKADVVYAFASGPRNAYTQAGYAVVGGPIANFDPDPFAGTSPAAPLDAFGQEMSRVWTSGFAAILRDDTFFRLSLCWFGRVSWPWEFNGFLVPDEAAFRARIAEFERNPPRDVCSRQEKL